MKRIILTIVASVIASQAIAEDTRKVYFTATLAGPDGKPFCMQSDGKGGCSANWTLGDIVLMALNRVSGDPAAQKESFKVLESISGAKAAELASDSQKRINDALWALRPSLARQNVELPLALVGAAVKAINPADVK